ncbi:glucosamine 6-phosphate N-acetyltransferase-like [Aristolochia californica]|uniref:glucosamine 6-phosphate N-acetyltransferase-like n=1 Tax=Aristolochia californica TaxID=171875 RepID=UPI0035D731E6
MEKEHTETRSTAEESYPIRLLQLSDKDKGFVDLLKQLTLCDSISDVDLAARFEDISAHGDDHIICVIEENHSQKIIAFGILFIEKKIIRNCGKVGRIEDIVVDFSIRGKHLEQKIIRFLSEHAKSVGCYKIIPDDDDEMNKEFYEKCGFKEKGVVMELYFD